MRSYSIIPSKGGYSTLVRYAIHLITLLYGCQGSAFFMDSDAICAVSRVSRYPSTGYQVSHRLPVRYIIPGFYPGTGMIPVGT